MSYDWFNRLSPHIQDLLKSWDALSDKEKTLFDIRAKPLLISGLNLFAREYLEKERKEV